MGRVIPTAIRHTQSSASAEWIIAHNLDFAGNSIPIIDAFTTTDGVVHKIIPESVEIINRSTARLLFSSDRSGFAIVLV